MSAPHGFRERAGAAVLSGLRRLHGRLSFRGEEHAGPDHLYLAERCGCRYGNSKVLAPEFRTPDKAWLVGRWLLEKSASRLRRDRFCTRELSFSARFVKRGGWSGSLTTPATQDTRHLMSLYNQLWRQFRARRTLGLIISISVHLGKVIPLSQRSGELFLPLEAGRASRSERLSDTIDKLNMRYGKRVIQYGRNQPHEGFFEKG